jgi:hypothetical protein
MEVVQIQKGLRLIETFKAHAVLPRPVSPNKAWSVYAHGSILMSPPWNVVKPRLKIGPRSTCEHLYQNQYWIIFYKFVFYGNQQGRPLPLFFFIYTSRDARVARTCFYYNFISTNKFKIKRFWCVSSSMHGMVRKTAPACSKARI